MVFPRIHHFLASTLLCLVALPTAARTGLAQEPVLTSAAIEQSSQQPVPTLVHSQGVLAKHASERLLLRFSIYAGEASRDPIWTEQQTVELGPKGEYSVLLGAGSAIGLPQGLFVAGEPRWLAVQVGEQEESRTLLTSVPYAMKAADAETVGGLPGSSFVTRAEFAAKLPSATTAAETSGTQPLATPTGGGTASTIPLWTSASALGSSVLYQTGTGATAKVGIGTPVPGAALDVVGTLNVRGNTKLASGVAATATAGANSPSFQMGASAFSSATSAAVAQNFLWQAQPTGNNTVNPSSKLALLFGAGAATPAATGLSIATDGVITFAPGQSFPSSSTSFPKGATFGAESFMTGSSTDWMLVATNTSSSSKGTILGQANATGIGVEGASPGGIGVEGASDSGFGIYGIGNTSGSGIYGAAYGTGKAGSFWSQNASGPAVVVSNVAGGTALSATATAGYGGLFSNNATYQATVYATNAGNGNAGYFTNSSASRVALAGVNASTDANAIATYGSVTNGKAVYGVATGGIGVYGTSGSGYGGYFTNNATYQATVNATNAGGATRGSSATIVRAGWPWQVPTLPPAPLQLELTGLHPRDTAYTEILRQALGLWAFQPPESEFRGSAARPQRCNMLQAPA